MSDILGFLHVSVQAEQAFGSKLAERRRVWFHSAVPASVTKLLSICKWLLRLCVDDEQQQDCSKVSCSELFLQCRVLI